MARFFTITTRGLYEYKLSNPLEWILKKTNYLMYYRLSLISPKMLFGEGKYAYI